MPQGVGGGGLLCLSHGATIITDQYRRACIRSIFQIKPTPRDAKIQCDLPFEYPVDRGYFSEHLASTRLPRSVVPEPLHRERQSPPEHFKSDPPVLNHVSHRPMNFDPLQYRNRDMTRFESSFSAF